MLEGLISNIFSAAFFECCNIERATLVEWNKKQLFELLEQFLSNYLERLQIIRYSRSRCLMTIIILFINSPLFIFSLTLIMQ